MRIIQCIEIIPTYNCHATLLVILIVQRLVNRNYVICLSSLDVIKIVINIIIEKSYC